METIPYIYPTKAGIESIFGSVAVLLRINDEEDGTPSAGELLNLDDILIEATDIANQYLAERYKVSDLANSLWVFRRCNYIACYLLSIRQGNPEQYLGKYNEILAEFQLVKDEKMSIPRIPVAYDNTPALSNIVVDRRYAQRQIRTQTSTSTGGTDATLNTDNNFTVDQ